MVWGMIGRRRVSTVKVDEGIEYGKGMGQAQPHSHHFPHLHPTPHPFSPRLPSSTTYPYPHPIPAHPVSSLTSSYPARIFAAFVEVVGFRCGRGEGGDGGGIG